MMKQGEKSFLLEKRCKKLLDDEANKIKLLKKTQRSNSGARVYMQYKKDRPYFTERVDGKRIGITGDNKKIEQLIQKEVDQKRLEVMEHNYKLLEAAITMFRKIDIKRLEPIIEAKNIQLSFYTQTQLDWMEEEYLKNQYRPEDLKYATPQGLRVRSKSERLIASRLEVNQVAFRYEMGIELGYETGYKIIYPDFVIRKDNGELVIWEHFGLMNDKEYRSNAITKIEEYRKIGYTQHKNLICTWEEDVTNANDIDEIIERFFL